jgi:hypothetical protein
MSKASALGLTFYAVLHKTALYLKVCTANFLIKTLPPFWQSFDYYTLNTFILSVTTFTATEFFTDIDSTFFIALSRFSVD